MEKIEVNNWNNEAVATKALYAIGFALLLVAIFIDNRIASKILINSTITIALCFAAYSLFKKKKYPLWISILFGVIFIVFLVYYWSNTNFASL